MLANMYEEKKKPAEEKELLFAKRDFPAQCGAMLFARSRNSAGRVPHSARLSKAPRPKPALSATSAGGCVWRGTLAGFSKSRDRQL